MPVAGKENILSMIVQNSNILSDIKRIQPKEKKNSSKCPLNNRRYSFVPFEISNETFKNYT